MTELIVTTTQEIVNDKIHVRDHHILNLINNVPIDYSYINFHDTGDFKTHDPNLHQKAFLNVISCTVFKYPHTFNSEKNFKPIVNLRPFVLVSSPGSLAYMRDTGFKTFSDYWSEEYDSIQDPLKRMVTIVELIEFICSKSTEDLKSMLIDMQDLLTYNYNFYYDSFKDVEIKKFDLACQRNLGVQ